MTWLLNEDKALKAKFAGLKVTDINAPTGGRPVAVRFRLPENELADLTFPSVIIDHAGISRDPEREHRGYVRLPYAPEGFLWWAADGDADSFDPSLSNYWAEFPIPVNIDYTITLLARRQTHNLALVAALMGQARLNPRYAFLEIPEDGTIRRLDIMSGPDHSPMIDQDAKRLFRTLYSIRVSSELVPEQIDTVIRALTVSLNLVSTTGTYG